MAAKVTRSSKKGGTVKKGGAAKKQAVAPANGSNRRTQEDWDSIVDEIREARQAGETMQALKAKYKVSSDVPLREALFRAGYNSKGEELDYEDISSLSGAKLKQRVTKEREQGTAWYKLALMTGRSESDLRELAGDVPIKRVASSSKAAAEPVKATAPPAKKSGAKKGRKVARKAAAADPS